MATNRLASWAANLKAESIPSSVYQAATRSFYNWIGCAIAGAGHEATQKTITALRPLLKSSSATSTILGIRNDELIPENKTDSQHAALINGIASHVHDFDDTHLATIIHPTGPVASALLAYSEFASSSNDLTSGSSTAPSPISGQAFLTALIAGIESECLLGLSVWPNHYDVGWHITSTVGTIGAAIAVGHAMNLSVEQMRNAIGIAASQVIGLREMFGTDTKAFHVGRAAQSGLLSAMLARGGFTASESALEGKRGWVSVVGNGVDHLEEMVSRLGKGDADGRWEMEKNAFKPFPCGIVVHPTIDACVQLHQELSGDGRLDFVENVKRVHLRVHPLVLELTGKKTPMDGLQAKFSVYHGGAVALVLGKATPKEYDTDMVLNADIVNVRDRIVAEVDDNMAADEAFVELEMQDGSMYKKHVKHAVGSLERPMTDQQLEEKFLDQVSPVLGQKNATEVSEACWHVMNVDDIREITQRCRG